MTEFAKRSVKNCGNFFYETRLRNFFIAVNSCSGKMSPCDGEGDRRIQFSGALTSPNSEFKERAVCKKKGFISACESPFLNIESNLNSKNGKVNGDENSKENAPVPVTK